MQILLIFSFVIAFLAILFAIQNTTVTPVRFLMWETEGSLALILFIALVAGALISYLATTPNQIRRRMTISNQQKEISKLEEHLKISQNELKDSREQLKQMEDQVSKQSSENTDNTNKDD